VPTVPIKFDHLEAQPQPTPPSEAPMSAALGGLGRLGFLLWGLGWGLCCAFAIVTLFAGLFPVALPAWALSVVAPFWFCSMRAKNIGVPWWSGAFFYGFFCVFVLVYELLLCKYYDVAQVSSVVFSLLATSLTTVLLTAPEGFASYKKYDTVGKAAAVLLSIVFVPWSFTGLSTSPPPAPIEFRDSPGSTPDMPNPRLENASRMESSREPSGE